MKKHRLFTAFASLAMLFLGGLPTFAQGNTTAVPFTETFDDDSHFTQGGNLPDGWASSATDGDKGFARAERYDNYPYVEPYSGEYYISSTATYNNRADAIFTPMLSLKGGNEYTISFYICYFDDYGYGRKPFYQLTAGNGQTVADQTINITEKVEVGNTEWQKVEAKFTPTEDGEYSIALQVTSNISWTGVISVDDFSVDGIGGGTEPPVVTPEITVPFTETLDDDSHFTQGGDLPDGWTATKTEGDKGYVRTLWYDYGVQPNSGDYYLASENMGIANRDEYLFTPMMQLTGGEEYSISFYILATDYDPGKYPSLEITAGNAQTAEAQTVVIKEKEALNAHEAWTKIEATFIPEADGKYRLALHTTSGVRSSGFILVDDISVDNTGGGTEPPVEEWEASIPYAENFDDAEHYDGEHQLPNGWRATGDDAFITANSDDVPAVSGLYYMVAPSSIIAERRDIAYSPLLEMEAGQEYKVSFYINMPGGDSTPSFKFTVGQDQANDMQETVLKEINRTTDGWERVNLTFTPETTGEYCFAFWALSTSSWAGLVCVDNFRLSKADDIFAPETNFEIGNTLHSISYEQPVLFPEQAVQMVNKTDDADSYTWSVTGGEATISDPTAVNPTITFKEAADYTITLKAENGGGTKEISRRFSPIFPEKDATDALQTTSSTDKIYEQADVPAFMEDGSVIDYGTKEVYQNYVVGVNPYYRSFAERFEIPAGSELTLTSISFYQMQYSLFAQTVSIGKDEEGNDIYSDMDTQKKLSVVIYPEKDGKPDVANPIYTKTDLISNLIDQDYHVKLMGIQFDDAAEPVTVDGTFYVAFEFDPLQIELWDPGVETSRSFVGLDTRIHANGQTTLWVKPEKAIPGSLFEQSGKLGEYVRADEFSQELAGYSFGVMPWVVYGESCVPTGIGDNVVTDNTFKLYASLDGNSFKVDGLQSGTTVQVYSANGTLVFSKKAEGDGMYIPAGNWAKGVYIITANGQSVKVVR